MTVKMCSIVILLLLFLCTVVCKGKASKNSYVTENFKVKILSLINGIGGPHNIKYPSYVSLTIPECFKNDIGVYGASILIWIAKKYWTGYGHIYADGIDKVFLHPIHNRKKYIKYEIYSSSRHAACAALPYFPGALSECKLYYPGYTIKSLNGLSIHSITKNIVEYKLINNGRYNVRGIAKYSGHLYDSFENIKFSYTNKDKSLYEYLIKYYLNRIIKNGTLNLWYIMDHNESPMIGHEYSTHLPQLGFRVA